MIQLIVYSLATSRVRRFRYVSDEEHAARSADYWLPIVAGEGRLERTPIAGEDAHETHVAVIVATGRMPTPLHQETERRALLHAPLAERTACDLHSIVNGSGDVVNIIHACPDCGDHSSHFPGHTLVRHGLDGKLPGALAQPDAS